MHDGKSLHPKELALFALRLRVKGDTGLWGEEAALKLAVRLSMPGVPVVLIEMTLSCPSQRTKEMEKEPNSGVASRIISGGVKQSNRTGWGCLWRGR